MKLGTYNIACFLCFLISFYVFLTCVVSIPGWSASCASVLPALVGGLAIAALVIVAVRTTIVAWITVLVILRFTGKRRRVLVVERRKITADVAVFLVKVLVKERGRLVAFFVATIFSSMAMASLTFSKEKDG